MKQFNLYSAIIAFALLCGCSNDDTDYSPTPAAEDPNVMIVKAKVATENFSSIEVGDYIGVYTVDNSTHMCIDSSNGGARFQVKSISGGYANLEANVYNSGSGDYTIYPYAPIGTINWAGGDANSSFDNREVSITIPSTQRPTKTGVDPSIGAVMFQPVDISSTSSNFNAGYLGKADGAVGVLSVSLKCANDFPEGILKSEKIVSATVKSTGGELAGAANISFGTSVDNMDLPSTINSVYNPDGEITLIYKDDEQMTLEDATLYFAVAGYQSFQGKIEVEVKTENGNQVMATWTPSSTAGNLGLADTIIDLGEYTEDTLDVTLTTVSNLADIWVAHFTFDDAANLGLNAIYNNTEYASATTESYSISKSTTLVNAEDAVHGKSVKIESNGIDIKDFLMFSDPDQIDFTKSHGFSFWVKSENNELFDTKFSRSLFAVTNNVQPDGENGYTQTDNITLTTDVNGAYTVLYSPLNSMKNNGLRTGKAWPKFLTFDLADGEWHCVYISVTNYLTYMNVSLYVDKELINTNATAIVPGADGDDYYLSFGLKGTKSAAQIGAFNGEIDDLRIYNAPLNDKALKDMYEEGQSALSSVE